MNQVAEKIQTEEGFEISLMPSENITLVWEQCEKFYRNLVNALMVEAHLKMFFIIV